MYIFKDKFCPKMLFVIQKYIKCIEPSSFHYIDEIKQKYFYLLNIFQIKKNDL